MDRPNNNFLIDFSIVELHQQKIINCFLHSFYAFFIIYVLCTMTVNLFRPATTLVTSRTLDVCARVCCDNSTVTWQSVYNRGLKAKCLRNVREGHWRRPYLRTSAVSYTHCFVNSLSYCCTILYVSVPIRNTDLQS